MAQLALIGEAPLDLDAIQERVSKRARPKNTRRAYDAGWGEFRLWCETRSVRPVPANPKTVADYLADRMARGLGYQALKQRRAAIRERHQRAGHANPCADQRVRDVWVTIVSETAPPKPTIGVLRDGLRSVVAAIALEDRTAGALGSPKVRLAAARDRAIVLLLHGGLLRRSELVSLDAGQIADDGDGVTIRVFRSRDRFRDVKVAFRHDHAICAIRALGDWMRLAGISEGPVFRRVDEHGRVLGERLTAEGVRFVWRRRAGLAGLDAKLVPVSALRDGAMKQQAYDGDTDQQVLDRAGLGVESLPALSNRVEPARQLRKRALPAPLVL